MEFVEFVGLIEFVELLDREEQSMGSLDDGSFSTVS